MILLKIAVLLLVISEIIQGICIIGMIKYLIKLEELLKILFRKELDIK